MVFPFPRRAFCAARDALDFFAICRHTSLAFLPNGAVREAFCAGWTAHFWRYLSGANLSLSTLEYDTTPTNQMGDLWHRLRAGADALVFCPVSCVSQRVKSSVEDCGSELLRQF